MKQKLIKALKEIEQNSDKYILLYRSTTVVACIYGGHELTVDFDVVDRHRGEWYFGVNDDRIAIFFDDFEVCAI